MKHKIKPIEIKEGIECDMTEGFQMFLLFAIIPILIFIWIHIRKKEINQIDSKIIDFLKNATPQPIPEHEKSGVKKSYVTSFVFGFISIWFLSEILNMCIERIYLSERIYIREKVVACSRITLLVSVCGLIFGLVGPLLWIAWDKKRIQTRAELIKLPAYVHSTSNLSTSYGNRTAYLIYFDRYKEKVRAKTVQIKQFESGNGRLHAEEFILIVAEDRNTKIRFVNIFKKIA